MQSDKPCGESGRVVAYARIHVSTSSITQLKGDKKKKKKTVPNTIRMIMSADVGLHSVRKVNLNENLFTCLYTARINRL